MKRCLLLLVMVFLPLTMFAAIPVINSVTPEMGNAAGGTSVAITGSKFSGTTSVLFGNTPAASFVVHSDSSITATSPAHVPEVTSVTITTSNGTSETSIDSYFTFQGNILAYVANLESSSVSVIDTNTNMVIKTIAVFDGPVALNISPDGSLVYVADTDIFQTGATVSVISGALQEIVNILNVGLGPYSIGVTFNDQQVYVVSAFDSPGIASAINTSNNEITNITVGEVPTSVTITPDSSKVVIANFHSDNIQIIDTNTNIAGAPINTGSEPSGAAVTPDGSQAYVVNIFSSPGVITAIDLKTNIPTNIPVIGNRPNSLAITPDGTKVYSVSYNSMFNNINVISTATNTVIDTISGLFGAFGIVINKEGTKAYISRINGNSPGTLSVLTIADNTVIATIPTGISPNTINISPDSTQIYIACASDGSVIVVDAITNAFKTSIAVGTRPTMIVLSPDQAPLAKFKQSLAPPGQQSVFDASASVSPTGTIANYAWDFGDGTTLNTNNPVVNHVYNAIGSYIVTLAVTNSAGTSTAQIINYSTYNSIINSTLSMPLTNNGGATAKISKEIVILEPPRNFEGCQASNKFLTQTDYINVLTWDAPLVGEVVSYGIYRNPELTNLVAIIPAREPLKYLDHKREKGKTYTYFLVAVDATGAQSIAVSTVVTPKNKCD